MTLITGIWLYIDSAQLVAVQPLQLRKAVVVSSSIAMAVS
jgi:hypothetical protein